MEYNSYTSFSSEEKQIDPDIQITIDRALAEYKNAISKAASNLKKQYEKYYREKGKNIAIDVKNTIMGAYQSCAYSAFSNIFKKYYGQDFDMTQVTDNFVFQINDKFIPSLHYQIKDFTTKQQQNSIKINFNKNNSSDNLWKAEDYVYENALYDTDFQSISFNEQDLYDEYNDLYVFKRKDQAFTNNIQVKTSSEVYKEAMALTQIRFKNEYQDIVKPKIKKKYNISL